MKTLSDTNAVSNKKDVSNTLTGSLDGSAIEKIQGNPMGQVMKDEVVNKSSKPTGNMLSMIVDLANKTKPTNNNNDNNDSIQGAAEGNQKQERPQNQNNHLARKSGQNGQEESSLGTSNKDFSYENADSMYSVSNHDSVDSNGGNRGTDSTTAGTAGSLGKGDHGNAAGITNTQESHNTNKDQEKSSQDPNNAQVDEGMGKSGGEGRTQGNINNTLIIKEQNNKPNIHTDTGFIAGGNDIQKDLKSKGLVRTVKGPDGGSAQVFLTKNGAHAGLVFRDYISRGQ